MNFVAAIAIGIVIGLAGWYVVRDKQPNAIWLAPLLGVVGAEVASIIATAVSEPGYGWKEIALQIVLAAAAVGSLAVVAMRRGTAAGGGTATGSAS